MNNNYDPVSQVDPGLFFSETALYLPHTSFHFITPSSASRNLLTILVLLTTLIASFGCNQLEDTKLDPKQINQQPNSVQYPISVTDSNGESVLFKQAPERIVAMDSAIVEILYSMGEGWRLIGTHDFVTYPLETKDIPKVGGASNLNLEAIVGLDPDLVFVFSQSAAEDLKMLGLKVLMIESINDDYLKISENIRMWGQIVDNQYEAEKIAVDIDIRISKIEDTMSEVTHSLSVFQDEGSLWTPGPDTLIGSVFNLLKLKNIAWDVNGYAIFNPEQIVARQPDIVVASYQDKISANPLFRDLPAVQNGRIFVPPSDLLVIPGPRYIEGIEALARWTYPNLFQ